MCRNLIDRVRYEPRYVQILDPKIKLKIGLNHRQKLRVNAGIMIAL